MVWWVVSLPVHNSASELWNQLQQNVSKHSFDTPLYRVTNYLIFFFFNSLLLLIHNFTLISQFNIPNLRVGTLDSLSDDLAEVSPPFPPSRFRRNPTMSLLKEIIEGDRGWYTKISWFLFCFPPLNLVRFRRCVVS